MTRNDAARSPLPTKDRADIEDAAATTPQGSRAHDMAAQALDAERAYVGCLLHMPAPLAGHALEHVTNADVADYGLQRTLGIVRRLAADGVDPCPPAVLAHARRHGLAGGDAIRSLSLLLADVFGSCPAPAMWAYYRGAVLDEALRRRCAEMAVRVGQAAERDSLDSLLVLIDTELAAVREVRQRRAAGEEVVS